MKRDWITHPLCYAETGSFQEAADYHSSNKQWWYCSMEEGHSVRHTRGGVHIFCLRMRRPHVVTSSVHTIGWLSSAECPVKMHCEGRITNENHGVISRFACCMRGVHVTACCGSPLIFLHRQMSHSMCITCGKCTPTSSTIHFSFFLISAYSDDTNFSFKLVFFLKAVVTGTDQLIMSTMVTLWAVVLALFTALCGDTAIIELCVQGVIVNIIL